MRNQDLIREGLTATDKDDAVDEITKAVEQIFDDDHVVELNVRIRRFCDYDTLSEKLKGWTFPTSLDVSIVSSRKT